MSCCVWRPNRLCQYSSDVVVARRIVRLRIDGLFVARQRLATLRSPSAVCTKQVAKQHFCSKRTTVRRGPTTTLQHLVHDRPWSINTYHHAFLSLCESLSIEVGPLRLTVICYRHDLLPAASQTNESITSVTILVCHHLNKVLFDWRCGRLWTPSPPPRR